MFNTQTLGGPALRLWAKTVGVVALAVCLGPYEQARWAGAQTGFTEASLRGTYAIVSPAEVRATVDGALLGRAVFDGSGNWTSRTVRNLHGTNQARQIEAFDSAGTYTVHPDGTGSSLSRTTFADGTQSEAPFDFVITRVGTEAGAPVATTLFAIPRLSSTGKASHLVFTRLAPGQGVAEGALSGTYTVVFSTGANDASGFGVWRFDGDGQFDGVLLTNANAPQAARGAAEAQPALLRCFPCLTGSGQELEREVTSTAVRGTYALSADGFGTLSLTLAAGDGVKAEEFDLLVTALSGEGGVASAAMALQRAPEDGEGQLRTLVITRRSD